MLFWRDGRFDYAPVRSSWRAAVRASGRTTFTSTGVGLDYRSIGQARNL